MGSNCKNSLVNDYKISEGKIHVVGSGADFRHPYAGRKTFGTKQILFQGSEFERKGGDLLLEAFKLTRMAIPNATLVVIGTDRIITHPGVTSLGYVSVREQVQKLFLSSDLVIAPARCDPFAAFVIEAMNYGVPAIVTKCSGISEVIDNGENGVVIGTLNPSDIAAEAIRLLSSPAELDRISNGGKRLVRERLNWDSIAARVSPFIQEILADRAP
jgi:glycosyltransferase involved in cell wall biosynthesis